MESSEPVFVDASGRRRRVLRLAGVVAGTLLAVFLAVIAVGFATGSGAPLTPWSTGDAGGGPNRADGGVTAVPKGDGGGTRSASPGRPSGVPAGPSGRAPAANPPTGSGGGTTAPAAPTTAPATSPAATTSAPGKSGSHTPPAHGRAKKSPVA